MRSREADWLPVDEALRRILEAVEPMPEAELPLHDALGRVLSRSIASPIDQPPWDNSAMDGFAVRASDVAGARPGAPVELRVVDDVPAGAQPTRRIGPGEAARVMTGAPVPEGADGVIRIEHTDAWEAVAAPAPPYPVRVLRADDAGRNIRHRGEDLQRGTQVLTAGRVLRPGEIGLLAAMGITAPPIHRPPRIGILSNGDELVEPERIDAVIDGRAIVNSNSYALAAAVRATAAIPLPLGIARDDRDSIRLHIEAARNADALITTAGASVGDHDLMKDVLEELGFELRFWRVRMRPGSPFSFGFLPDAASGRALPVFGLAGNPVSALVTFEVLVRPAIRRMLGRADVHPRTIDVELAEPFPSTARLTHFLRARIESRPNGPAIARLTGPQGSGILRSVVDADALVIVPEGIDGLPAGARSNAIPLARPDAAAYEAGYTP